jgi:hypothetical protein
MPSLRCPFDSIGRLRVNLRRFWVSALGTLALTHSFFPLSHSVPQPARRNTDDHTMSKPKVSVSSRRQRHYEPLSLLVSRSSLLRMGSGEAPVAGEQCRREPLQRRARRSVGGCAAVERLHGGTLPACALTNRGSTVILLPAVPSLRDAATMTAAATAALRMTAARWEPEPKLEHSLTTGGPRSTYATVEASADGSSAGARAHDGFYPHDNSGFHRGTNQGMSFETLCFNFIRIRSETSPLSNFCPN